METNTILAIIAGLTLVSQFIGGFVVWRITQAVNKTKIEYCENSILDLAGEFNDFKKETKEDFFKLTTEFTKVVSSLDLTMRQMKDQFHEMNGELKEVKGYLKAKNENN